MKRYFLLLMSLWGKKIKLYFYASLIGGVIGLFIFYPIYDFIFIYFHEDGVTEPSALSYVMNQLIKSLRWKTPGKTILLFEIGMVFGLVNAWVYESIHYKLQQIEQLSNELGKDLLATISQGEGPFLEFKSSFRWDIQQARVNRSLENVVLKTLAGFMNSSNGGTLLIGVADDGQILGLQQDYQSLKRKDNDGFEQAIMTAISEKLGADLCTKVQVLFHVVDGKEICRLIVVPSSRAVFLSQGNSQQFYLRTGGATRGLNIKEASEFITDRWGR